MGFCLKAASMAADRRSDDEANTPEPQSGFQGEGGPVYLRVCGSVSEARASIGRYLIFYNGRRPHSSLDHKTPDHVYFNRPLLAAA